MCRQERPKYCRNSKSEREIFVCADFVNLLYESTTSVIRKKNPTRNEHPYTFLVRVFFIITEVSPSYNKLTCSAQNNISLSGLGFLQYFGLSCRHI
jgi:hypothetical protein